jgi:hypothetical protein
MVARAARANGLGYMFLTDDDPKLLLEAGLQQHNEPGRFLAMPGTEIMFRDVHMNAMNVRGFVAKQGAEPAHVETWIQEVKATGTEEHPVAVLLNHPSHIERVKKLQPYFRSWWVADRFGSVDLTENFDFDTWFDRLNQGIRLPGLWTTDAHDIAFYPPGKKCTYVYAGERPTEASIIRALIEGRSFNTRAPGAMLHVRANGASMGETALAGEDGAVAVEVSCRSSRPLRRVELVADGRVVKAWEGRGGVRFDAETTLSFEAAKGAPAARWIVARAYAYEEDSGIWPVDDTTMEPLLESGCIAFTNPVWVERGAAR